MNTAFILFILASSLWASAPVRSAHSSAALIPEFSAIVPGQEFRLALTIRPDPGWHTYWRNSGDSGAAPILKWNVPDAIEIGQPLWPFPRRLQAGPLVNFGYEDELVLIVPAQAAPGASATQRLTLEAEWLVCQEECVPASGRFTLALPAQAKAIADPEWSSVWARALPRLPKSPAPWSLNAFARGDQLVIKGGSSEEPAPAGMEFFPEEAQVIDHAAPQRFSASPGEWTLTLKKASDAQISPLRLKGVLVADGARAYDVDMPIGSARANMFALLAFAFMGGLLLNLMPCVFPVLSIKVLSFVEHSREGRARAHGLAFGAGVLISFWALAGLLLLLRAQGQRIGWGYQLQSPAMLGALAALFVVLGLNMLGVFEFGTRLTRLGALTAGAGGLRGSFLSGALATIVATPCTAPFMGTAIGVALTLAPLAALAAFTALAGGMALPYVALTFFPAGLRLLPRPGAWMATLKKALSAPLFATALWLLWVLGQQLGAVQPNAAGWEKYSEQALARHLDRGEDVFVNFTAAWCVTCQVNERVTLRKPEIQAALRRPGLALLKADWTSRDPEITAALDRLGRSGVPVYVLYRHGQEPRLLPTLLTPAIVIEAVAPNK